jgi:hypothetical protein
MGEACLAPTEDVGKDPNSNVYAWEGEGRESGFETRPYSRSLRGRSMLRPYIPNFST